MSFDLASTKGQGARGIAVAAALTGAAIWLLTRRYAGDVGDGRLYAMMALALNDPRPSAPIYS